MHSTPPLLPWPPLTERPLPLADRRVALVRAGECVGQFVGPELRAQTELFLRGRERDREAARRAPRG